MMTNQAVINVYIYLYSLDYHLSSLLVHDVKTSGC